MVYQGATLMDMGLRVARGFDCATHVCRIRRPRRHRALQPRWLRDRLVRHTIDLGAAWGMRMVLRHLRVDMATPLPREELATRGTGTRPGHEA